VQQDTWTRDDAAHLLRRAGFGGTPEQIDKLTLLGRDGAVNFLLDGPQAGSAAVLPAVSFEDFKATPPPTPDPELVRKAQAGFAMRRAMRGRPPQTQPSTQVVDGVTYDEAQQAAQMLQQIVRRNQNQNLARLRVWWIDRMVRSDRPLEEKMSLFWHGLFTSGVRELNDNSMYLVAQNALFHREALGNYKQLTHDVIHDPAMLVYLNNDQNLRGRPNENLAREMMELFTMGEGQGYTETDIKNIARALTGLAPNRGGQRFGQQFGMGAMMAPPAGQMAPTTQPAQTVAVLRPFAHDQGAKTIFGKTGNFGPDDVVNLIFSQPQPARYLARKLWQFYAYADPSDADLAPLVSALEESKFELKPALRAMFTSAAFYSQKARFALIKSPTELEVEEMRTLGITPNATEEAALVRQLRSMDQELLQPPNVRGWVGGDNWITAATLYTRYNTASAAVNGALRFGDAAPRFDRRQGRIFAAAAGDAAQPSALFASLGTTPQPAAVVDNAISRFLQRPLSAEKRDALLDVVGAEPLTLGNAQSDERVREMLCLLMSTPEYQVH
jgi:uncharacterized protein (DUF1800 family)